MRYTAFFSSRIRAALLAIVVAATGLAAAPALANAAPSVSAAAAPGPITWDYNPYRFTLNQYGEFTGAPPSHSLEYGRTGDWPWAFTGSNLPPGITIDRVTGAVEGVPTLAGSFESPISLTAADGRRISGKLFFTVRTAPTGLQALTPTRILDTRSSGTGPLRGADIAGDEITSQELQITGRAGLPASGVDSVVLNVTVTSPTKNSNLRLWPSGAEQPNTSNLNYVRGQTVPNLVIAKVGDYGRIELENAAGAAHVIVDITGWFPARSEYTSVTPSRIMDTRSTGVTIDGQAQRTGALGTQTRSLKVAGRAGTGIPANAAAVAVNVTAVRPTAASHLTLWPAGSRKPGASNLNYKPGVVRPNLAVIGVGSDGSINVANGAGQVDVIVDIAGWFSAAGVFTPVTPARLQDTRTAGGAFGPGTTRTLKVTGRGGVPNDARAVVLNVTATRPNASSYVTVWPGGARPNASSLNFTAGLTAPNLVIVKVGPGGTISLYNNRGNVDLIVDVAGYWR